MALRADLGADHPSVGCWAFSRRGAETGGTKHVRAASWGEPRAVSNLGAFKKKSKSRSEEEGEAQTKRRDEDTQAISQAQSLMKAK